jgi:integration host factor subunit alpha
MEITKKSDLVETLADRMKVTKKTSREFIDSFLEEISKSLSRGERVKLSGFGVFWTKVFQEKQVLPIGGGSKKKIAARRMPRFSPGAWLKRKVR